MFEKVRGIIAEQLGVEEANITMESTFQDDLGADSLDLFQMIMALEEEFGIEIPNDQAEKMSSVGDVMKFIENK